MISPGALVPVKQTGAALYRVKAPATGGRWFLAGKRVDERGRFDIFGRVAGAGDLTLIRDAPMFMPGEMIEHEGVYHEVVRDLGDEVELTAPAGRNPLNGGGGVRVPGGHITTISSDLVLNLMR